MRRLLALLLAGLPATTLAQQPQQPAGAPAGAPARPPGGYRNFGELTKDAVVRTGYFDTYQKEDKLYLAIPKDRLGKDFLMEMKIAQGIGTSGLFGGTMLSLFEANVVAIERHGEQLFLVQRPHRFTARNNPAAARAVDLTFGASVLEVARIESFRDDSAVVVDAANWFVSDLSGIGQAVRFAVSTTPGRPGAATFDRTRS